MTKKAESEQRRDALMKLDKSKAEQDRKVRERQLVKSMWKGNTPGAGVESTARRRGPRRDHHEKRAERSARRQADDFVPRERPPWYVQDFLVDADTFGHRLTPLERAIVFMKWCRPGPVPSLAAIARDLGGHDESTVRNAYARAEQECQWLSTVIYPIIRKGERREKLTAEERAEWRRFRQPREGRAQVSGMWVPPWEEMPKGMPVGRTADD